MAGNLTYSSSGILLLLLLVHAALCLSSAHAQATAPKNLSSTAPQENRHIILSWQRPSTVAGTLLHYQVNYSEVTLPENTGYVLTGNTNYTFTALNISTAYNFKVVAVTTVGIGAPAATTATTNQDMPPAPTYAVLRHDQQVSVNFSALVDPTSYAFRDICCQVILRSVQGNASYYESRHWCSQRYGHSSAVLTYTGQPYDALFTIYSVVVNTVNLHGIPIYFQFTTDDAAPLSAPGGVVIARSPTHTNVSWDDIPFLHYRGVPSGFLVELGIPVTYSVNVTGLTVRLDQLTPYTTYHIRIYAKSSGGIGPPAEKNYTAVPWQITAFSIAYQQTPTSIIAAVTAPVGEFNISKYCCQVTRTAVQGNASYTLPAIEQCSASTIIVVDRLEEDSEYTVTATASNRFGAGGPISYPFKTWTLPAAPKGVPFNIRQTASTGNSVNVSWDPFPFLLRNGRNFYYNIQFSLQGGAMNMINTTGTEIHISGLDLDTAVSVEVRAVSSGGSGMYSTPTTVSTTQNTPEKPSAILFHKLETALVAVVTAPVGQYHISKFCCQFIRTAVQGNTSYSLPAVTRCSDSNIVVVSGLEEDSHYLVTATVNNTLGASSPSSTSFMTSTLSTAPSAIPIHIRQTAATMTSVGVSWDTIPFLHQNGRDTTYTIRYSIPGSLAVNTTTTTSASVQFSGLGADTVLTVQVRADSSGGAGMYSAPYNVSTSPMADAGKASAASALSLSDFIAPVIGSLVLGFILAALVVCLWFRTRTSKDSVRPDDGQAADIRSKDGNNVKDSGSHLSSLQLMDNEAYGHNPSYADLPETPIPLLAQDQKNARREVRSGSSISQFSMESPATDEHAFIAGCPETKSFPESSYVEANTRYCEIHPTPLTSVATGLGRDGKYPAVQSGQQHYEVP